MPFWTHFTSSSSPLWSFASASLSPSQSQEDCSLCALLDLRHTIAFLYIYLLILSLHPLPYPIHPCPHNPARAEMWGPRGKGGISFVIMTVAFSTIPDMKWKLRKGLLNEWVSKQRLSNMENDMLLLQNILYNINVSLHLLYSHKALILGEM